MTKAYFIPERLSLRWALESFGEGLITHRRVEAVFRRFFQHFLPLYEEWGL